MALNLRVIRSKQNNVKIERMLHPNSQVKPLPNAATVANKNSLNTGVQKLFTNTSGLHYECESNCKRNLFNIKRVFSAIKSIIDF